VERKGSRSSLVPPKVTVSTAKHRVLNEQLNGKRGVAVWESQRSCLDEIARIVSECDAEALAVHNTSVVKDIEASSFCSIAIVGLGENLSPDDPSFQVLRLWKEKGFRTISYGKDISALPLGVQCQALLAGAAVLLDSGKAIFFEELRDELTRLLRSENRKWTEENTIQAKMAELGVVGQSAAIRSVFRDIMRVSTLSDLPVLLTGETGTGKEVLAHAIHRLDPKRYKGPLVAINCSAISPNLVESELFGHRRGAFTDADRDRKGLIRSAQGGILFLDEIGELEEPLQAKLLRVLQEKRVLGVGEDAEVPVDARVIAATNRDLAERVKQKKFRADLFHRLSVLSVRIPPLRERPQDIKPLIEYFLNKYRSMSATMTLGVTAKFVDALTRLELTGNARQLENLLWQALVNKNDDSTLDLTDFPAEVWQELSHDTSDSVPEKLFPAERPPIEVRASNVSRLAPSPQFLTVLEANGWNIARSVSHCERLFLEVALRATRGNQSEAARLLKITPRSVYNKIRKYGLQHWSR
jgi:two-component system response regulator PilR (NtrC family)